MDLDQGFYTLKDNDKGGDEKEGHGTNRKEGIEDLLDDNIKDSPAKGDDNVIQGKTKKTVIGATGFNTPETRSKKTRTVSPASARAMELEEEALGFKRCIDELPAPYTKAEFQPIDPDDENQPKRKFSNAGRKFVKEEMGIDSYNFPGGFPKSAAVQALRNVINTQTDGSHVKMIMDIQATEKNKLGFWGTTVSCQLAECIWELKDEFFIVVHGQVTDSSPIKPSQLMEEDDDDDMNDEDDERKLVRRTKEEQKVHQTTVDLYQ